MESIKPLHYLARRENWQQAAAAGGAQAEKDVVSTLHNYLDTCYPGQYEVVSHPRDLDQIYYEYAYERNPSLFQKPTNPTSDDIWYDTTTKSFQTISKTKVPKECYARGGGGILDCKIKHVVSGKAIFLECKNQSDSGNAHERAAKYATPSVIAHVQKKLGATYHPFAYIFTGSIVENKSYVVELEMTYGFASDFLFLWKKGRTADSLVEWLERVILPQLCISRA